MPRELSSIISPISGTLELKYSYRSDLRPAVKSDLIVKRLIGFISMLVVEYIVEDGLFCLRRSSVATGFLISPYPEIPVAAAHLGIVPPYNGFP